MFKRIILLFLIIYAFKGCTKDDICPPDTATTSNLVITFNDIANPTVLKKVNFLTVKTNNSDSIEVISRTSTDSIVLPLNTNRDTTKYLFIKTTITETDTIVDIDKMMFTYSRENGYVNRACGFRTEFDNLISTLEEEGNENWIEQVIPKRETVKDENSAHLTLLH
ncbi:hypothetical protein H4O20_12255 [Aequorivita sp. 609]|uniref:DUF6452 family protein n=1 Tax=Aequorivita TaxID=153265 RepID=UPI0016136BC0|nr:MULTISPECIES: DUF6452 family protein [Aequorivita]MBB6682218.1 hypothetical protein [Aequorivita sp. 609]